LLEPEEVDSLMLHPRDQVGDSFGGSVRDVSFTPSGDLLPLLDGDVCMRIAASQKPSQFLRTNLIEVPHRSVQQRLNRT
jgi:hypothetical protein